MCSQLLGFKSRWITPFGAMQERVYHGRKFDTVIVRSCRSVALPRTTVLHWSQHRITSFAVCRGSKWRTHLTYVSLTVSTVKLLLLQTLYWNIFWIGRGRQHYFLCKLSALIRRVDTRGSLPVASEAFTEIKLASCHLLHALCGLCVPKLLNFVDAFNCYKQKCKLAPINLAHPGCVSVCQFSVRR